jgi:hypothetical protein
MVYFLTEPIQVAVTLAIGIIALAVLSAVGVIKILSRVSAVTTNSNGVTRRRFIKAGVLLAGVFGLGATGLRIRDVAALNCSCWVFSGTYGGCQFCVAPCRDEICIICYAARYDIWSIYDRDDNGICTQAFCFSRQVVGPFNFCCLSPCGEG